jgi:hypothetical protein
MKRSRHSQRRTTPTDSPVVDCPAFWTRTNLCPSGLAEPQTGQRGPGVTCLSDAELSGFRCGIKPAPRSGLLIRLLPQVARIVGPLGERCRGRCSAYARMGEREDGQSGEQHGAENLRNGRGDLVEPVAQQLAQHEGKRGTGADQPGDGALFRPW